MYLMDMLGSDRFRLPPKAEQIHRWSAERLLEIRRSLVPVDRVPPGLEIIRSSVLILQIVGMFPHVDADDRLGADRDRVS